jgi:polyisoprenoid-binding protein YceI
MKGWLAFASASIAAASVAAQPVPYVIDPTHTFVMYEIGHFGTTTNRGRFSTKDGSVQFDRAGKSGQVEVIMDMTSVNTGVDALNRQIQGRDFFNVAQFPTGRFVSTNWVFDGDKVREVSGILTLVGQSHPVTLRANRFNCYMSPILRREICGGDFETTIERSKWGVTWGLTFGFEDAVRLLIQVEAIKLQ